MILGIRQRRRVMNRAGRTIAGLGVWRSGIRRVRCNALVSLVSRVKIPSQAVGRTAGLGWWRGYQNQGRFWLELVDHRCWAERRSVELRNCRECSGADASMRSGEHDDIIRAWQRTMNKQHWSQMFACYYDRILFGKGWKQRSVDHGKQQSNLYVQYLVE